MIAAARSTRAFLEGKGVVQHPHRRRQAVSLKGSNTVRTRSKLVLLLVSAPIALFATAGSVLADPSDLFFAPVPPHRHFVATPSGGLSAIGPQVCEHPELQQAFDQFHYNVHHSHVPPFLGGPGDVPTLGPQNGAKGMTNDKGSEIAIGLC